MGSILSMDQQTYKVGYVCTSNIGAGTAIITYGSAELEPHQNQTAALLVAKLLYNLKCPSHHMYVVCLKRFWGNVNFWLL